MYHPFFQFVLPRLGQAALDILLYLNFLQLPPLQLVAQWPVLYYGLPQSGLRLSADTAGLLALTLYHGAYFSEILRGQRLVIPKGLIEAALAELTAASGRAFRFEDETLEQAHASRRRDYPGHPDWEYDAWVSTYVAVASGALSQVSEDVSLLLGRPATSVAQFGLSLRV